MKADAIANAFEGCLREQRIIHLGFLQAKQIRLVALQPGQTWSRRRTEHAQLAISTGFLQAFETLSMFRSQTMPDPTTIATGAVVVTCSWSQLNPRHR